MISLESTTGLFHLFGDATRIRLLALLAKEELTVAEITLITDLAQSRISTHLGRLKDAGLLRDRKQGASTFYTINEARMPDEARRVWQLVEGQVGDALLESDRQRCQALRHAKDSESWPDSIAGEIGTTLFAGTHLGGYRARFARISRTG